MASNCNTTPTSNICIPCGTPNPNNQNSGCLDIYNTSCIQYDGGNLLCANIPTGTFLNDALCAINNSLCSLQDDDGLVKTSITDTNPGTLSDKLVAGANIVITGIGSGDDQQLQISAVLGGQIQDQYVKVSSIDQTAGYLSDKLTTGPCISLVKVNPGLSEKLSVVIDWNCVLNQLSQLPGFCTLVNACIPNAPTITCPYIVLNNPNISGSTLTSTWLSSGMSFNVYVDGQLVPNMPTSSLTYTATNLSNGSHTVEVVAVCNTGTPNRDSQTFLINTTCPVPNQVTVGIVNGTASLSWVLDTNANNGPETVQYKYSTVSNWITATNLPSNSTSYAIPGLTANKLYDFQIINNCSSGGPSPSTVFTTIQQTCPNLSVASTSNSVSYSFVNLGGDTSNYVISLFDSTGTTIIQTQTQNPPFTSTITNSFNGLTAGTSYQVQMVVNSGTFSKTCGAQTISTSAIPTCPTTSNLTLTASS